MTTKVFVFPLQQVILYPHSRIPLHIFEPRYLKMVNDAIENDVNIAITPPPEHDQSDSDRFAGVLAGIGKPQILKKHNDGRLIILVSGTAKARLGRVITESPYIQCEAQVVEDDSNLNLPNQFKLNRLAQELQKWADDNIEDAATHHQFIESLESADIVVETGALIFLDDREQQQELLELNDVNERLDTLLRFLQEQKQAAQNE